MEANDTLERLDHDQLNECLKLYDITEAAVQDLPTRSSWYPEDYLQYCKVCCRLADQVDLSLRDLDRALWAKSWRNDLRKLVEGL